MQRSTHRLAFSILISILVLLPITESVAHDRMLPIVELTGNAHKIFVGTVESIELIDGAGLPRTKVTLKVIGTVGEKAVRGKNLQRITLNQLGGEVEGQTLAHAHQPAWEIGESYLVFQADPADGAMHDVYGGEAGYYRLVQDLVSDDIYPVDAHDRPILGIRGGRFDLGRPVTSIRNGRAALTEAEAFFDAPVSSDGEIGTVATFEDEIEILNLDAVLDIISDALGTAPRPMPRPIDVGYPMGGMDLQQRGLGLCWCGYHNIFLVYEQVSSSWSNYDNNEWSMAEFNYYLNLHKYTGDDGTWGAPNGEDELAGFTSSSSLNAMYGSGSGWGSSTLAVNWTWSSGGCSRITEADIHMNPAYSWRYEFKDAFQGGSREFFYDPIMMHEMGHSLGLERSSCNEDYQFDRNTIMSAGSNTFVETGRGLHRRDASVLRTVYDTNQNQANTINRTDMGVESWYMDGSIRNGDIQESDVRQGDSITMRNLVIENVSTWDVSNVRVRCYFSRNMTISECDYQSDTAYYQWSNFNFNSDWRGDLVWKVPSDLPVGDYYVGVIVTYNGLSYASDGVWGNNATFFPDKVTVTSGAPATWEVTQIPLDWFLNTQFFVNTSAAANGPTPPNCPGAGPDKGFQFKPRVSGKFELVPSDFLEVDTSGGQRIITSACDTNNEILATNCETSATNPLVFEVEPNREYRVRIYTSDGQPIEGWFNGRVIPDVEFGSVPQLPIEWNQGQDQELGQEFGAPVQLPCAGETNSGRWYVYTPSIDGLLVASTCDQSTDFPSVVSIHRFQEGTPVLGCGSFQDQVCADSNGAIATAGVERGVPILVRVASLDNPGRFSLDLRMENVQDEDIKCDTAPVIDQSGVYLVSGVNSIPIDVTNCENVRDPRRGTWREVTVPTNSELIVTPCVDLGGSSKSRMSVFIFGGDCDSLEPIACDNFPCAQGGAIAEVPEGRYRVFFQTDDAAEVVITINGLPCFADVNGDGIVDSGDLGLLLGAWGACSGCPQDLDGNGTVDAADLGLLLAAFGDCP